MNTATIRIVVDATRSPTGRLIGSVTSANGDRLTFSGTLELLACIENAVDGDPNNSPTT